MKDNINPAHYGRENAMECIDEMIFIFGEHAVMDFCLLNVWKYRYRAGAKNGQEDLEKSDWYMAKYKELSEKYINRIKDAPIKLSANPYQE